VLIQICDDTDFPKPAYVFEQVHQFNFLDVDNDDSCGAITNQQADKIASILKEAFDAGNNVVVHCHAGLCRSGAVAEIGCMLGFATTAKPRIPNVLVKTKLINSLGWGYAN
jgi:predicted protein tyrosine phosphatase